MFKTTWTIVWKLGALANFIGLNCSGIVPFQMERLFQLVEEPRFDWSISLRSCSELYCDEIVFTIMALVCNVDSYQNKEGFCHRRSNSRLLY